MRRFVCLSLGARHTSKFREPPLLQVLYFLLQSCVLLGELLAALFQLADPRPEFVIIFFLFDQSGLGGRHLVFDLCRAGQ